jgi:RND superfamily putative drug exporter
MSSLAHWCSRNRWLVVAAWLVALIVLGGLDGAAKPAYSNKFSLPNTPSTQALNLEKAHFPAQAGDTDEIVFQTTQGTVESPQVKARVTAMLDQVAQLPDVTATVSPYQPLGAHQISRDGSTAFARVNFKEQANLIPKASVERVIKTAEGVSTPTLKVALGGQAISQDEHQQQSSGTPYGIAVALLVLLVVFGALFAALLPLITALCAIGVGTAVTGLLTHVMAVADFATILGVLIGLGVGVDYALFITTRHRNGLRSGRSVEDAIANAVNTSGRAVFFAGLTVCIALLGQFALGVSFLYGVAATSAITVALTMLAALTLLPALLRFFGYRVLSRRERKRIGIEVGTFHRPQPLPGAQFHSEHTEGFWYRWARAIEHGPGLRALAGLIVVVVIALPVLGLRLGLDDAGSDPASTTSRQSYDMLAKGFGPGFNGPFDLVAQVSSPADLAAFRQLASTVSEQPGVVHLPATVRVSPDRQLATATVYPATSPQSAQSASLLTRLRDTVVPRAEAGTSLEVIVGGTTAGQQDFANVLSSKLPQFIAVVVVLAFLLLMVVFRSLVIPAVASVMNLLSVGAALGIMDAVFERGWGASLIGVTQTGPVEVFIPVILFSILFGLSMDYEVFLVSRIHEEWVRTGDNTEAVTRGQAETGRVITAAALIMIFVFLSFLLGSTLVIQQFGIGLAGAIIVDAFIIRTLVVPSVMHLCGRANWWLPGWLDRLLPNVSVEAPDEPIQPPEEHLPVPAGR